MFHRSFLRSWIPLLPTLLAAACSAPANLGSAGNETGQKQPPPALTVASIAKGQGPRRQALPVTASAAESSALLARADQLKAFLDGEGKGWTATFDRRSGQPMLLRGPGIPWMPGSGNSLDPAASMGANFLTMPAKDQTLLLAAHAEGQARALLASRPGLLGVSSANLTLDRQWTGSPDGSNEMFLATFRHAPGGLEQHDARLTFVISHGNLIQIHSERVIPGLDNLQPGLSPEQAFSAMRRSAQVAAEPKLVTQDLKAVLLATTAEAPGVYSGAVGSGYEQHLAYLFRFHLQDDSKTFAAYVDSASGEVLELFDDNKYGSVSGGVFPRTSSQSELVVPFVDTAVTNGSNLISDLGGNYSYSSGTASSSLGGANLAVSDSCGTPNGSTASSPGNISFGTSTGTDCSLSSSGNATRAGRNAFYHLNNVRQMGQKWLQGTNASAASWFGTDVTATVNVNQTCNAFWDGSAVNFFRSGGGCNNTGEISDVMQHEWGHGLDQNTKSGSVGDSAKGEAVADTVALLMTHDQCIGPNFFSSGTGGETAACPSAVRDLAKVVTQANISSICQTSTGCAGALGFECHCESHILSGAHWKLQQLFVQRYGATEGWNRFERGYLRALPNLTAYLPGTAGNAYDAWIAGDDDNGNTSDGTPNADIIFQAFNGQGIAGTQVAQHAVQCPTAPASPSVTATGGAGSVALSWTAVSGATSYSIFRQQGGNDGQGFLPLAANASGTSFSDNQVRAGYGYTYQVVANVGACQSAYGAGASATPTTGGGPNDFSLALSPASSTVAAGASTTVAVSSAVTAGSAQSISLSVSGLPAGVTGSFNPTSVTAGSSSTLTLTAASGAASASASYTVTGTATSGSHTASGSLTVNGSGGGAGALTNGGFETGNLTGWTVTGSAVATTPGHGGTYAAQVGSTTPSTDSSISQTFTLPANASTVSFFYKITCPDTITYDWASATLKDNTTGTTTTMLANTCTSSGTWVQATANVIGGHSVTLTLSNHDDNYAGDPTFTLYDDVTVGTSGGGGGGGITNGGFETGTLSGWTASGASTSVANSGCHGGTWCARAGASTPTNGDSSIAQTFTVPTGKSTLSIWYSNSCPDTVTYDWVTITLKDNAGNTTATVLPKTCTAAGWKNVTASVTAGKSYTLTLTSHDDNYSTDPTFTLFDDVSLQ